MNPPSISVLLKWFLWLGVYPLLKEITHNLLLNQLLIPEHLPSEWGIVPYTLGVPGPCWLGYQIAAVSSRRHEKAIIMAEKVAVIIRKMDSIFWTNYFKLTTIYMGKRGIGKHGTCDRKSKNLFVTIAAWSLTCSMLIQANEESTFNVASAEAIILKRVRS